MSITVRPYRRGGWEVDIAFMWPDGEKFRDRRRAPVSSESAARRWGAAREVELLRKGKPVPAVTPAPRKEVPTLREFAPRFLDEYCRANRQKPSGVDAKDRVLKRHLLPRLGDRPLDQIRNEDIQQLKATFAGYEPKTVNNVLSVLSKLLKIAVEWDVIERVPCRFGLLKVERKELGFYEATQYVRLVEGARDRDPRIHAMVLLGGDAGLRRGEMIGLQWTDVDLSRRQIHVRRSVWKGIATVPKGGRGRWVPMTEALERALRSLRHLRCEWVLCEDDGSPVTANILGRWVESAARHAGLEAKRALHILRHTFCSQLSMRSVPAKAIQELAGHASLSTTLGYMHLSPASRIDAIHALDRMHVEARAELDREQARGDILETVSLAGSKASNSN